MNDIIHEADRLEAEGNPLGLLLRWHREPLRTSLPNPRIGWFENRTPTGNVVAAQIASGNGDGFGDGSSENAGGRAGDGDGLSGRMFYVRMAEDWIANGNGNGIGQGVGLSQRFRQPQLYLSNGDGSGIPSHGRRTGKVV